MNNKTFVEMFGFDHPAARLSEAVVIIIDMQREYLDGSVPVPDLHAAVKGAAELIARAHQHGTPVIHVLNKGPSGNLLFNEQGPYYAELPEIAAKPGDQIVVKHLPNAFAGTNLQALIENTGRKQLIIAGCTTHVCISATARAALDLGYKNTIVADATTSRDLDDGFGNRIAATVVKQVALAELRDAFSVIVKSADDLLI
ncbi:isochorismatase [Cellvibrio zantedeschiae]|uniref:Isochorismatase n=1 Tax=Cellvibrio zantedeschiae TaxID=1237077 RepID=A0ABQ3B5R9_9GAMM|nr:cysteine hydrolase family protein [Cellvibrio zantedeschiae]GGY80922.1 isochorismatase [Cellvibrio zantedeschiae]